MFAIPASAGFARLLVAAAAIASAGLALADAAGAAGVGDPVPRTAAPPQPAVRWRGPAPQKAIVADPTRAPAVTPAAALAERLKRLNAAKSWGYQLNGAKVEELAASPYDLLVVDGTTGLAAGRHFKPAEVAALKIKPDGSRRLVTSYLSIGEAEDYRPEYFSKEYLEEDAPDWLRQENKDWKGNRLIAFCHEGWQQTILGDENGRSVYDSIEPSPLYRLIEMGFDGVYLDRADVYEEVGKDCPDAERKMVDFVARLAAHARKQNPHFIVILQNAEDLLKHKKMVDAIDAVGKESLYHGWGGGDGSNKAQASAASSVKWSLDRLNLAKNAGRAIFVVDYTGNRAAAELSLRKIREHGYVPYIGPKELNQLWLPGKNY